MKSSCPATLSSPRSFSVVQAGAIPRFADVNLEDHCISIESAEKLVNERTKAIMPVHLYGNVCDMDKSARSPRSTTCSSSKTTPKPLAAATKARRPARWGDIAGCSFCQNKTFTTGGEGGMVTTDDEDLAWKARSFRDHGYDVKDRLNLLEMEQKLPYIHNLRRLELSHDRNAIRHRPRRTGSHGQLEHAQPPAQCARSSSMRSKQFAAGEVLPDRHTRTAERLVSSWPSRSISRT